MARRDTGFPPEVREIIVDRARGLCEINRPGCSLIVTDLHHRVNRGAGGSRRDDINRPAACLALCRTCHRWVTEHPRASYEQGWSIRKLDPRSPAEVPALYRGSWVSLDNYGRVERKAA